MSRSRESRKRTVAAVAERLDMVEARAERGLRDRALEILARPCPECRAGWGLACRSAGGALAPFHRPRIHGSGPVKLPGVVEAPPAELWPALVVKARDRAFQAARVRELVGGAGCSPEVPTFRLGRDV